jgi:hypothetical protein
VAERAIRIEANGVRLYAILHDTPAGSLLWEALPIIGTARVADGEVAFDADLQAPTGHDAPGAGDAKPGDLLYRKRQKAMALLFAPSGEAGAAPRPADPEAQICGRITGDASRLARVRAGARVKLSALEG